MKRHVMTNEHDFIQACSLHGETKQTLSAVWRSLGAQMSVWFSSFLLQLEEKKKCFLRGIMASEHIGKVQESHHRLERSSPKNMMSKGAGSDQ